MQTRLTLALLTTAFAVAVVLALPANDPAPTAPRPLPPTPTTQTAGEKITVPPKPEPVAVPSSHGLAAAFRYAKTRHGRVSYAVIDSRGRLSGFHPNAGYKSASAVKALLLLAYLRAHASGALPLDAATRATLRRMIVESDNDAASFIYGRIGDRGLSAIAALAGMESFTVMGYWGDNQLTAADLARFWWRLPRLLPAATRQFALDTLGGVVRWQRWGIAAAADSLGWHVYFKGGWRGDPPARLVHQGARLVRGHTHLAIAVLTESPSQAYGQQTLEGIARRLLSG